MFLTKDIERAWLVTGAAIVFVLAETCYTFFPDVGTSKAYYWTRSFSFAVIAYVLYRLCARPRVKTAALFLLGLALSDLIDELFFDPTEVSLNEYLSLAVISLVTVKKWRRLRGK